MPSKKVIQMEQKMAPDIQLETARIVFAAAWEIVSFIAKNAPDRGFIYLHELFSRETGHLLIPTVALVETSYWLDAMRVAADCELINFERHMALTIPKRTVEFIKTHGPTLNAQPSRAVERELLQKVFGKWAKVGE